MRCCRYKRACGLRSLIALSAHSCCIASPQTRGALLRIKTSSACAPSHCARCSTMLSWFDNSAVYLASIARSHASFHAAWNCVAATSYPRARLLRLCICLPRRFLVRANAITRIAWLRVSRRASLYTTPLAIKRTGGTRIPSSRGRRRDVRQAGIGRKMAKNWRRKR